MNNLYSLLNQLISLSQEIGELLNQDRYEELNSLMSQRAVLYEELRKREDLLGPEMLPFLTELRALEESVQQLAREKKKAIAQKLSQIPRKKEALKAYEGYRAL